jgi:hypothetical protein
MVAAQQRFTAGHPCPVCEGHAQLASGNGQRCYGYVSSDGEYAHCTRPEFAGALTTAKDETFAHRLAGDCRCGVRHGASEPHREHYRKNENRNLSAAKAANPAKVPGELVARIWRQTAPLAGTLAARYLAGRSLVGPFPPALRFHPRLWHTPSAQFLPALVASVTRWPSLELVAIHRTYLGPDRPAKADVVPVRLALGPVRSGAVCLGPATERLALAEGIETALSVQQAASMPTWATLGASFLPSVVLPPLPLARELTICADPDPAGLRAAHRAAERWTIEGRRVRIAVPPTGLDFNDLLRAEVG